MAELLTPSDVEVKDVYIETSTGKRLKIDDLIVEFNVYESIYTPILRGDMLILDATSLFSSLPIVGQEKISGTIIRGDETKTFSFYTTDVADIRNVNDYTLEYKLNLIEEAYYYNAVSLVSESYEGSVSDIVKRIAEDYLKIDIEVEQTSGNYKFVIPNWNPYRAIRWLTRRAYNENNVPFVCYNTFYNGVQFRSLESIFGKELTETFSYKEKKANKTEAQIQAGTFSNYMEYARTAFLFRQLELAPMTELVNNGAYASRTQLIDTMNKNYKIFDYNYNENFDRQPRVAKSKVLSDKFLIGEKSVYEQPTTRQTNFVHSGLSFGDSHYDYNGDVFNSSPHLHSYLNTLNNYRYRMGVPGRMDLEVGSAVGVEVNKNAVMTENEKGDVKDVRRSGKHIITSLRHQFSNNDNYQLIMDVARDTMGADHDEAV